MSNARVTTHPFERSHGHKPRGFGNWAFQASDGLAGFDDELSGDVEFITGTFADARAEATRRFADERFIAVLG